MNTMTEDLLRQERKAQGMSQRTLAFFADVSPMTISKIERGQLSPTPATKTRIARALRLRVDVLWPDGDEEKQGPAPSLP